MGKGRKLTASRSQRYLQSYAGHGYRYDGGDESEFSEEDVWSVVGGDSDMNRDRVDDSSTDWSKHVGIGAVDRRSVVPQRGDDQRVGGLSLAFEDSSAASSTAVAASPRIVLQFWGGDGAAAFSRGEPQMASSAPVDVPDWSRIYRTDSVESVQGLVDNGYEDRGWEMVPPHEYVAREYARSRKMMAPSVFEGQGRTLKGRDMSRVRDAVWSQTGFDG